jgi:hypothetical protein
MITIFTPTKIRRALAISFSMLAVLVLVGQQSVSALSAEQQKAFQEQVLYFNTEVCVGSNVTAADVNLTGSDNAEKAFNFFVQKKLSVEQAAGIVANLWAESGVNPTRHQVGGPAYGIAQWEDPRLSAMRSWVTSNGGDPNSMAGQLSWYWHELQTTEKAAFGKIKDAKSTKDATIAVWVYFERAALAAQYGRGDRSAKVMEELSRRYGAANKYLELYGGTAGASEGTAGETEDGGDTEASADTDITCANGGTTQIGQGKGKFTDNTTKTYPGVNAMLARAKAISDLKGSTFRNICTNNPLNAINCQRLCSYMMARVWGKGSSGKNYAVGSNAGNGLWYYLLSTGHGHPNDRSVPVGALLFYKTGSIAGHVAIYLGNNKVLSNDVLDSTSKVTGGAYITDASALEGSPWRLTYLGWADPAYPT